MPTNQNDAIVANAEVIDVPAVEKAMASSRERLVYEPDPMRQWEAMLAQAQTLVRSGFLPKSINTAEKALAVMQTGKELGIGPMQSIRAIHIIDAKPTMSAELIAGLVLSRIPGAMLRVVETTEERCVVHAARPGHEPTPFTFTIQDAKQAGIAGKDNWRKYPRAMLRSRCITEAARAIFPDATMGLYDADELGAITNPSGEIVALPPTHQTPEDRVQDDIAETTHGSLDEAKRQKILTRAQEVLEPLVPGSPRYLWAMEEIFRSQDWAVVKGFSLKKLDADTRGRITQIVEQAMDTPEELATKLLEEQTPIEDRIEGAERAKIKSQMDEEDRERATKSKATLIASIRKHIEKIPEGPAREDAMNKAFGSASWTDLESYSLKEVEEVVEGGRIAKIVKDALAAAK